MTAEKIIEVISLYEKKVPGEIARRREQNVALIQLDALEHLMEMFPQMREFVRDGRREKLMRWLGWVQGCCSCAMSTHSKK